MTELPESIFDLIDLESFRLRPGMYLQIKSIDVLRAFIDGYQYALDSYKVKDEKNERFEKFREWVLEYYSRPQYTGGWNHIILENCKGDQEKSVDKFFELYDKFKMDQNALQHKL
jgi:hypothetical protein